MIKFDQRLLITLFYWLSTFCDGAARIIIPLYFVGLGVKPQNIGLTFFYYEFSAFFTNIFAGFLLNRLGYKKGFVIALGLHTLASAIYVAVHPDLTMIILMTLVGISRALRGSAKELIKTTSVAYLKKRGHSGKQYLYAQILLGGNEGLKGVGVLAGGILLSSLTFSNAFIALGLITFIPMIVATTILADVRETTSLNFHEFTKVKPKMKRLATMRAFLYASQDVWMLAGLPIYLVEKGYPPMSISILLAVGTIVFGAIQPPFARLVHQGITFRGKVIFGKIRYRDCMFYTTFPLVLIPIVLLFDPQSITVIMLTVIACNLFAGMATTSHNHLHLKYARDRRSSVDIAYYKAVAQLGKLLAALASGYLYQYMHFSGCLGLGIASAGASSIIAFGFIKRKAAKNSIDPESEKTIEKSAD